MIKYGWLFIVILLFALIINILFLVGFYYEFYNRCNHKDLIQKIKSEVYFSFEYELVFCEYEYSNNDIYNSKNFKPILIVLNVIYGLSLLIAYITFVVSLYQNAKCGLKCSLIFFLSSVILSFFNIIISIAYISPLPDKLSPELSEELQKEIKEAYISVENVNILVKFFSVSSLILSLFCGISNLYFYSKVKKEEEDNDLKKLLEETNKNGNNSDKNCSKNDKNTESLVDNLSEENNN